MTLEVEVSRAPRRPGELRALVDGVEAARPEDEADWIEWKSDLNLADKETRAVLARHVIGMANRRVEEAGRFAEGFGFILVGVEPGNRCGVSPVDLAELDAGIEPYLGSAGPRWTASYDTAHDRASVLIITVDPPRHGDRIHTLYRDFGKYRAGDIFVRKSARTERAGPGDIDYLTQRAAKRHLRLELDVRIEPATPLVRPLVGLADFIDSWLARQRNRLLAPLHNSALGPPHGEGSLSLDQAQVRTLRTAPRGGRELTDLETAALVAARRGRGNPFGRLVVYAERRTPDDYRQEVESYLTICRRTLLWHAYSAYLHQAGPAFSVEIANKVERNFRDVEVLVICDEDSCEFAGYIAASRAHTNRWSNLAHCWRLPPPPFGPQITASRPPTDDIYWRSVIESMKPGWQHEKIATEQLRPKATYRQDCYFIATNPDTVAPMRWEATAVNVDGRIEGALTAQVGGPPLFAAELLQPVLADLPDFLLQPWEPPGDMEIFSHPRARGLGEQY